MFIKKYMLLNLMAYQIIKSALLPYPLVCSKPVSMFCHRYPFSDADPIVDSLGKDSYGNTFLRKGTALRRILGQSAWM